MEHAHPHSERCLAPQHDYISPNGPPARRPFRSVPNTPSPLRSPQPEEGPFSLQHRRLQLRNAGFRAPRMPSHRISARLSRWIASRDEQDPEPQKQNQQENTAPTRKRKHAQTTAIVPSHILQEITNSTRPRSHRRRSAIQIFEDASDRSSPEFTSSPGRARQTMRSHSRSVPAMGSCIDGEWPLRELSSNERSPMSLSCSPADRIGRKRTRTLSLRRASFEASQYIEHLESQLVATQESIMSPRTGKPIQDKVKILSRDNTRLKQMVEEWEDQFDARVREAVEHRAMAEMDLYRRVKLLEDQLSQRDAMIRDLESINDRTQHDLSYLESLKLSIEKLEDERFSLEATNRSLERRNDVLTELLAQSPTRAEAGIGLSSPSRERPSWTTPRPQSMLPRLSTSPRASCIYRPISVQVSLTGTPESGYFDHHDVSNETNRLPYNESAEGDETIVRSPNSAIDEFRSVPSSAINSTSQRSSLISSSSGPTAGALPPPLFSPGGQKGKSRNRRSRRFAPGSTTLKPLVLSALNGATQSNTNSPPDATPLKTDCVSPTSRRSTRPSDLASRLLANEGFFETPTQPRRQSSEEALRALEGGNEEHFESFDEVLAKHGLGGQQRYSPHSEPSPGLEGLRDAPGFQQRSIDQVIAQQHLFKDDILSSEDRAMTEDKTSSPAVAASPCGFVPSPLQDFPPRLRRVSALSFSYQHHPTPVARSDNEAGRDSHTRPQLPLSKPFKPAKSRIESKGSSVSTGRPQLSSARSLSSTSDSYARLFRNLGHDPTAIARRVIANAWRSQWRLLGRLSWWVLGLFFGRRVEGGGFRENRRGSGKGDNMYELEGSPVSGGGGGDEKARNKDAKLESPSKEKGCHNEKTTWRQSIYLWGKFSFAIMLAVGGAVVKGPGAMLGECEQQSSGGEVDGQSRREQQVADGEEGRVAATTREDTPAEIEDTSPQSASGPGSKDTVIHHRPFSLLPQAGENSPNARPSTAPDLLDYRSPGLGVGDGDGLEYTPTRKTASIKKRRMPGRGSLDLVLRLSPRKGFEG